MKKTIILTALTGFLTSMIGNTIISNMFHPERDHRMDQLARYSFGVVGLYHPIKWWYEKLEKQQYRLPVAFFGASFVFGLSVLFTGIYREISR